jgi:hypothetical protein
MDELIESEFYYYRLKFGTFIFETFSDRCLLVEGASCTVVQTYFLPYAQQSPVVALDNLAASSV